MAVEHQPPPRRMARTRATRLVTKPEVARSTSAPGTSARISLAAASAQARVSPGGLGDGTATSARVHDTVAAGAGVGGESWAGGLGHGGSLAPKRERRQPSVAWIASAAAVPLAQAPPTVPA